MTGYKNGNRSRCGEQCKNSGSQSSVRLAEKTVFARIEDQKKPKKGRKRNIIGRGLYPQKFCDKIF